MPHCWQILIDAFLSLLKTETIKLLFFFLLPKVLPIRLWKMPRWLERRTSSIEIRVKYHVAERMSHCQNASLNEDLKTRTFVLEKQTFDALTFSNKAAVNQKCVLIYLWSFLVDYTCFFHLLASQITTLSSTSLSMMELHLPSRRIFKLIFSIQKVTNLKTSTLCLITRSIFFASCATFCSQLSETGSRLECKTRAKI